MPKDDEIVLPKLPKRDLSEVERMRNFVWEDGDTVIIKNPGPPKKSGATKKPGKGAGGCGETGPGAIS